MSLFPNNSQADIIKAHGLHPFAYIVLGETEFGIIVRHLIDHQVKHLRKDGGNC